MHKKALVMAIGAALAVQGALAAKGGMAEDGPDSVIELYGKVYPEIVRPHGRNPTDIGTPVATFAAAPTGRSAIIERNEVESSNSRFGVRGQEKLGPNLRAIFQLETEFHVDSNNSRFAQRDSFVGLAHRNFGTVRLGRMDTPFKSYGDETSFLGISSGNFVSTSNVLRKPGFGTSSSSSFHLRRQNMVDYETPQFAGFQGEVQYSTDEADTASRRPHVWSGAVKWEGGPFTVSLAHEKHFDLFGGSRNVPTAMSNFTDASVRSRDKATQVMVKWNINKAHTVEADFIQKKYDENATVNGRFQSYKNNAYELIWAARWSNSWRTQLAYIKGMKGSCARVNAVCSTDGLDGTQINAGFAYNFSKRTYLFVIASLMRNGYSAVYNNSASQAPSTGEDITQYAVGLSHSF